MRACMPVTGQHMCQKAFWDLCSCAVVWWRLAHCTSITGEQGLPVTGHIFRHGGSRSAHVPFVTCTAFWLSFVHCTCQQLSVDYLSEAISSGMVAASRDMHQKAFCDLRSWLRLVHCMHQQTAEQ